MRRWSVLAEKSAPRARRSGNRVEVRWQLDADDATELAALVEAERVCCSFVSWTVSSEGTQRVLTVTADPAKPDDVAAIAALFGAT